MNRISQFFETADLRSGQSPPNPWSDWPSPSSGKHEDDWPFDFSKVVKEYEKRLKRPTEESNILRKLNELSDKVERHEKLLNEIFGSAEELSVGSFEEWCASEDAIKYSGKHVIFVHSKGVIASADELDVLLSKVDGILEEGTHIGIVPII